ncbi:MAG: undecaprenyldiphospho-muramoylpentapeptide beta-N-acetylglucosaminyltransferase [Gammaproteobacteria bacterium]
MSLRILIMAGGTGGHVFPALAVAETLRSQGVNVMWLGTRAGLEADIVPRAGIDISFISISGLRGKSWLSWLLAPSKLTVAFMQSLMLLIRLRPNAVLGMGGFVAGPGGFSAWLLDKPLVIHEQNAIAGLTNRLLAPLASKVLEGFPGSLHTRHALHTGNPVRAEITAVTEPEQRLTGRSGALRLLVLGGSLGAQIFNEVVPKSLHAFAPDARPEVWHQTGARNIDAARQCYQEAGVTARLVPFIGDMAEAYGWADLVLCRAGALTVAELACAGVAAILVPYPHAVDDHQTHNARYLADAGAAVLVPQPGLTPAYLTDLLKDFSQARNRLLAMAQAARNCAQPEAAARVAALCREAAHG